MTARFLHSFPARNALRVVKQNQKMTIVTFILYLLGIPMIMGSLMLELVIDTNRDKGYYTYFEPGLYIVIGGFCLSAAVFMGMIAAINSFTELHNKSKVDMLYSLPLTGQQRFFSDFTGGCCIYILPYVGSVILGWIITLTMGSLVNWDSDYVGEDGGFGVICRYYALVTFGLLALMLLYFALSTLITVCCGTLFESIYTNVLLNLLIPGTLAAVIAVITDNVELDFFYSWQVIGFVSPVGGLIYLVYLISDPYDISYVFDGYRRYFHASQATEHSMIQAYLRWIVIVVVIAVLLVAAAWQLYVHRKAEHVGKPFTYLAAYYVMLTAGTVLILCLLNADVVGPALLFAAIVYFVMEVIRKRGFRRFWMTIITYVVTVGVSVGLFLLVVNTGCFGRVRYVPPAAAVNSVAIGFEASFGSNMSVMLEYTDRDVISAITRLHRSIVDNRRKQESVTELNKSMTEQKLLELDFNSSYDMDGSGEYSLSPPSYYGELNKNALSFEWEDGYYSGAYDNTVSGYFSAIKDGAVGRYVSTSDLEISYYTLTGSLIHRSYDLLPDEYMQLMEIVQGTELYAKAYAEQMKDEMLDSFEEYNSTTRKYEIPLRAKLLVRSPFESNVNYYSSDSTIQNFVVVHPLEVIEKLGAAYQEDLSAMTPEQFRTSPVRCFMYNTPVYEACTGTLALLKEYGFEGFTLEELYRGTQGYSYYDGTNYRVSSYAVRIYAPGTYVSASQSYPCSRLGGFYVQNDAEGIPAYQDQCLAMYKNNLSEFYPELAALMQVAQKHYISAEECYALVVNGDTYIVPAEYSDLAEAVIEKGDWYVTYNGGAPSPSEDEGFYEENEPDEWDNWEDWGSAAGGGTFAPGPPTAQVS